MILPIPPGSPKPPTTEDYLRSVLWDVASGRDLGSSVGQAAGQALGRWAAGQLFGSAAAAGPAGLILGAVGGGLLSGLFRSRKRQEPPAAKRQVVAEPIYTELAKELPARQQAMTSAIMRELMAQVGTAFGGNKLLAASARDALAQNFAKAIPQLEAMRTESLFNLMQLAHQDRMSRRQAGTALLQTQMNIDAELARQKAANNAALTNALVGMVLNSIFKK